MGLIDVRSQSQVQTLFRALQSQINPTISSNLLRSVTLTPNRSAADPWTSISPVKQPTICRGSFFTSCPWVQYKIWFKIQLLINQSTAFTEILTQFCLVFITQVGSDITIDSAMTQSIRRR